MERIAVIVFDKKERERNGIHAFRRNPTRKRKPTEPENEAKDDPPEDEKVAAITKTTPDKSDPSWLQDWSQQDKGPNK